jgi:hypothetical protein
MTQKKKGAGCEESKQGSNIQSERGWRGNEIYESGEG